MGSQLQVTCDNPKCKNWGTPEWVAETTLEKAGLEEGALPYSPPYAWIRAKITYWGCGPFLEVDVCKAECLSPAVKRKLEEYVNEQTR